MHLATGCPLTAADATAAAAAAPDESGPAELRRSRRRPRSMRGWKAGSWPMSRPPFRLHAAPERHSNHAAPAVRQQLKQTHCHAPLEEREKSTALAEGADKVHWEESFLVCEKSTGNAIDRKSVRWIALSTQKRFALVRGGPKRALCSQRSRKRLTGLAREPAPQT